MSPETGGRTRPSEAEIVSRLTDLHYAIFELLPDEGRTLAYNPQVITAKHLAGKLNSKLAAGEPQVTTGRLGSELRTLKDFGFVVAVQALGGRILGWQRTPRGRALLMERQQTQVTQNERTKGPGFLRRVGGES